MPRTFRPDLTPRRLVLAVAAALAVAGCADAPEQISGPDELRTSVSARLGDLETVIAAQEKHNPTFLALTGVVGTGVGVDAHGEHVIRVFTVQPGIRDVPSRVDGIRVVPVTTGMFVAGNVNDPTSRERPAPNGFSVGHPDITAGTLGAVVTDGSSVFILSNNHVLANSNDASIGDPALQPGPVDGGTAADQIGTLFAFEPINFSGNNTIDAAIASVNGARVTASTPSFAYGAPGTSPVSASVGQGVQKFGRTTGHTTGVVAETNVTVDVCYEPRGPFRCASLARFVNQFTVSDGSFSDGGDSGSLIVTNNSSKNPVGLLFAGSSTRTIANPIADVLNAFSVSITADSGDGTSDNNPPDAVFTSNCTDLHCSFDGSGSSDGDGNIVSYAWDFGDGDGDTGAVVSHTYVSEGTFTVSLTVTDDDDARDTASQEVTVVDPNGGGFTLSASGSKVQGRHTIDLTWSGASGTNVDIVRDDAVITTTANDGAFTDSTDNRGKATYVYQVCEAGTATCSNTVQVVF